MSIYESEWDVIEAFLKRKRAVADDAEALDNIAMYPKWTPGLVFTSGQDGNWLINGMNSGIQSNDTKGLRYRYGDKLYRLVPPGHTTQNGWEPPLVPALWVEVSVEEWPTWVQPSGAHDAYAVGAKCSHNEKHWINNAPGNIYEPGVYGWDEVA